MMTAHLLFEPFAQIVDEVKSISNLPCLRGTLTSAFGIEMEKWEAAQTRVRRLIP